MSAGGPKVTFTDEEKIQFRPLFILWASKKLDAKGVLSALGGNKDAFNRFKLYAAEAKQFLEETKDERAELQQANQKISDLNQQRTLLTQSIADREARIAQARAEASASITTSCSSVTVSNKF